jgi:hypothetical protein
MPRLKRYAYILETGDSQWSLETTRKMPPLQVFKALYPRISEEAKTLGIIFSVSGGDLDEPVYVSTERALRHIGKWIE